MKILLRSETDMKLVKVGFSWTVLFFNFIPALFRGDFKWAVSIFLITVLIYVVILSIVGNIIKTDLFKNPGLWSYCIFIGQYYFATLYNKKYVNKLIEKGYVPVSEEDKEIFDNNFL